MSIVRSIARLQLVLLLTLGAATSRADTVSLDGVRGVFDEIRTELDADGDGWVSEAELNAAIKNPEFRDRSAQVIAFLKLFFEELQGLSNDELGSEDDGITAADVAEFDRRVRLQEESEMIGAWVRMYFPKIDRDGDGYLTDDELDKAIRGGGFSPAATRFIKLLRDRSAEVAGMSNDEYGRETSGVTKEDLKAFSDGAKEKLAWVDHRKEVMSDADSQNGEAVENPFGAVPGDSFGPGAAKQAYQGDCYFWATLISLAAVDPAAIIRMIQDNGDGTYTVTFPGKDPVTVKKPTAAEMALFGPTKGQYGFWGALIQKAYGQCLLGRPAEDGELEQEALPNASKINRLEQAIGLLTGGRKNEDWVGSTSLETLHSRLASAMNAGLPAVAGTWNGQKHGLTNNHVYAVTGYDPENRIVTLVNPEQPGGSMKMTLKEFSEKFFFAGYGVPSGIVLPEYSGVVPPMAPEFASLPEAVIGGTLAMRVVGDGTTTSRVTCIFENRSDEAFTCEIPVGMCLLPASVFYQVMMVTESTPLSVPPREKVEIELPTLCAARRTILPPPPEEEEQAYLPMPHPDPEIGERLVSVIETARELGETDAFDACPIPEERREDTIRQLAVWHVLGEDTPELEDDVTTDQIREDLLEKAGVEPESLSEEQEEKIDEGVDAIFAAVDLTAKVSRDSL